jgi:hypothetical protein
VRDLPNSGGEDKWSALTRKLVTVVTETVKEQYPSTFQLSDPGLLVADRPVQFVSYAAETADQYDWHADVAFGPASKHGHWTVSFSVQLTDSDQCV